VGPFGQFIIVCHFTPLSSFAIAARAILSVRARYLSSASSLSGVKRTYLFAPQMSANDPRRTPANLFSSVNETRYLHSG
jgi:hypothetical protein